MSDDQVYVANTTFSTDFEGASIVVHAGRDRVRGNHPLYLSCPSMFDPVDDHVRYDVETAAATPGVDRGSSAPSPAAAKPAPPAATPPAAVKPAPAKPAAKPAPAPAAKQKAKS